MILYSFQPGFRHHRGAEVLKCTKCKESCRNMPLHAHKGVTLLPQPATSSHCSLLPGLRLSMKAFAPTAVAEYTLVFCTANYGPESV